MITSPEIIRATEDDVEIVHHLGRQTFLEAFAKDNTAEDIHTYVNEAFAANKIAEELAHAESEFYLAKSERLPIGYLKLNHGRAQTEQHDLQAVEIERIYVTRQHYGKKVGQLLFAKALEVAQQRKASCLWLGVWEKNLGAIRFYRKQGFSSFDTHSFLLGKDLQTDLLMKLELPQL